MISTTFLILRSSFMAVPSVERVGGSLCDLVLAFTIRISGTFSVSQETLFTFSDFFHESSGGIEKPEQGRL